MPLYFSLKVIFASMNKMVLYLSYDGMTDPLGQSQVLSYLIELSKKGVDFTLVSFEKKERFEKLKPDVEKLITGTSIQWVPMMYTKRPPVLSTLYDIVRLRRKVKHYLTSADFSIVHCRGYITSIVGLWAKRKLGVKFIFDMRALYADERVDGGLWPQSNPVYRWIYKYFKKKEKAFLLEADHTISLTELGKKVIIESIIKKEVPIEVIPCCVNESLFDRSKVPSNKISELRQKLSINDGETVLSYVGSIGTWYLPNEMMQLFSVLLKKDPKAVFLFITGEEKQKLYELAENNNVPTSSIRVVKGMHHEVPALLALSNYSVFFIKPVFSKSGSSPTKMGEIMAMGIPLICNGGVGDVEMIVNETNCGVLLEQMNLDTYQKAIDEITSTNWNPSKLRQGALNYYSLEKGVNLYYNVYLQLMSR